MTERARVALALRAGSAGRHAPLAGPEGRLNVPGRPRAATIWKAVRHASA